MTNPGNKTSSEIEISTDTIRDFVVNRDAVIAGQLLDGSNILRQMASQLVEPLGKVADIIICALQSGKKILICGNGGSAADAQHLAAELVGRFRRNRQPFPAIALTTDTSILTAVGNDYGFDHVFARQITALGKPDDVLIAISTSGKSPNILTAVEAAHVQEMKVVAFTGIKPFSMVDDIDLNLCIPASDTAQIQQGHIAAFHVICDLVEQALTHDAE